MELTFPPSDFAHFGTMKMGFWLSPLKACCLRHQATFLKHQRSLESVCGSAIGSHSGNVIAPIEPLLPQWIRNVTIVIPNDLASFAHGSFLPVYPWLQNKYWCQLRRWQWIVARCLTFSSPRFFGPTATWHYCGPQIWWFAIPKSDFWKQFYGRCSSSPWQWVCIPKRASICCSKPIQQQYDGRMCLFHWHC